MLTTNDLYKQYAELEELWKKINIKKDLRLFKSKNSSRCSSKKSSKKY
jgi:hypothetical protein